MDTEQSTQTDSCALCSARKSREHELLRWLVEVIHERDRAKAQLARLTQPPCCRPETTESLGARIRRLREEQETSLSAFAATIGTTKSHLSQVERDASTPGVDVFARIADGLGVPLDTLYWGEADRKE